MARQLKFELGKVQSPTKKLRAKPSLLPNGATAMPNNSSSEAQDKFLSPLKRNKHNDLQYGASAHNGGISRGTASSSPTKKYKQLIEPTTPDGSTAYFNQLRKKDSQGQQVALKPRTNGQTPHNNIKKQAGERYAHAGQTLTQGSYLPVNDVSTGEVKKSDNDDSFQNELGADLLMYLASSPYNSMNAAPSSVLKSIDGNPHLQHSSASINNYNILQTPSRNFGLEGLMASAGGNDGTNSRLNGNNDGLHLLHHSSSETNSNSTVDDHADTKNKEFKQTNKNLKQQLQKEVIPMTPLNRSRGKPTRISGKSNTRDTVQKKNQRNKIFDEDDDNLIEENENDVTEDETDVDENIRKSSTPPNLLGGDHDVVIGQDNNYMNSRQFINKQAGQMMISSSPPREFDSPSVYTQLMLFSPAKASKGSQNGMDGFGKTQEADKLIDHTVEVETGRVLGYMRRGSDSRNDEDDKFGASNNLLKTPSRPINGVSGNTSGFFLPPNSATANFMMMKTPNTQQLASISRLLLDSGGLSAGAARSNGLDRHLEKLSAATRAVETNDNAGEQSNEAQRQESAHLGEAGRNTTASTNAETSASKAPDSNTSSDNETKGKFQQVGPGMNKNGQQNQNNSNFSMGEYMNNLFSPSPRVSSHRKN
ncbi:hypothetical protein ACO0QE_000264 [Hanseniaspora vineae]